MENKENKIEFNDSVELYQEIISSNDSDLMVKASNYYLHRRSFVDFFESINFEERSLKLLEKAVELNDSNAMLLLGNIHRFGTDYVGKHPAYANDLFYSGAELGNAECMLKLAEMYMDEYFEDDENYHEAVFWLKKAIDFGSVEALLSLANLYEQGLGVEKNYEIANKLRKVAEDKLQSQ